MKSEFRSLVGERTQIYIIYIVYCIRSPLNERNSLFTPYQCSASYYNIHESGMSYYELQDTTY